MSLSLKRVFLYISVSMAVAISVFVALIITYFHQPGPLIDKKVLVLEKGQGVHGISQQMADAGIIDNPLWFELHMRLRGLSGQIRAGEYAVLPGMTPAQVADLLVSGLQVQHPFTVPEGFRSKDVVALLYNETHLDTREMPVFREGEVLPETYNYIRNESANVLILRMKKAMQEALNKIWVQKSEDFVLASKDELLVLASIVEKETGLASERPMVAAVFLNRLKIGMPLQSDPTVLYGLMAEQGIDKQILSKADLKIATSYNTYMITGLPPAPICNPGISSLEAVIHPAETKALYFVADGTGGHVFSETYEEHKKNHQKWRAIRDKS
ncbi:MAG: endolytic transglycosylase MltG [Alphaproteobacteria bacterium]|nr:endolytic transglycosylase MltG [Alphaproteobacteria bacterium]